VKATPAFIVGEKLIVGFDRAQIDEAIASSVTH
jgi:hypothetical protein